MTTRPWNPIENASAYCGWDADAEVAPQYGALSAGDRTVPLPKPSRVLKRICRLAGIGLVAAGGFMTLEGRLDWRSAIPADAFNMLVKWTAGRPEIAVSSAETKALPGDRPEIAAKPDAEKVAVIEAVPAATPDLTAATVAQPTEPAEPVVIEPLTPPSVDPSDALQVRAMAAGLHPGLSRVLLARLTAVDYRNAGTAIKTALAETPEQGTHIWPSTSTPELAVFKVRFVPGAGGDCRRYVVEISKDGWLTTALPLEKCGIRSKIGTSRSG